MDKKVVKAMNEHINFEMHSGYIYLQLALKMEKENYKGYSSWLLTHYEEEFGHAKDFINYLLKRDVTPELADIKTVDIKVKTPLDVAKAVYEHEKKVTEKIYKLHDLAKQANDYATEIFLHTYITEQIEEEDIAKNNLDRFTLAGDNVSARLAVDLTFENK